MSVFFLFTYLLLICLFYFKKDKSLIGLGFVSFVCILLQEIHDYYLLNSYNGSLDQWLYFTTIMLINTVWFSGVLYFKPKAELLMPLGFMCAIPLLKVIALIINPYSTFLYNHIYPISIYIGHIWFVYVLISDSYKGGNCVVEDIDTNYTNRNTNKDYIYNLRNTIKEHYKGRGMNHG